MALPVSKTLKKEWTYMSRIRFEAIFQAIFIFINNIKGGNSDVS